MEVIPVVDDAGKAQAAIINEDTVRADVNTMDEVVQRLNRELAESGAQHSIYAYVEYSGQKHSSTETNNGLPVDCTGVINGGMQDNTAATKDSGENCISDGIRMEEEPGSPEVDRGGP